MFTKDIGIDLGTANTLVYMKGRGIIMREPSVVAVDPRSDELRVRSVGHEAKAVIGRAPGSIVAVRPLKDGVIADFDVTAAMLQSFIRQACGNSILARPRVVICVPSGVTEVDPPRKGLDATARDAILKMQPPKVVYVSCDPATLARDVAELCGAGYTLEKAQAFDLFPRTFHVETVVLLSKGEVDSKKIRVEFSLEDMDMSEFQDGATYPQIKEYVLEHTGLKVSNLYISQIKRKCGIGVGKNYNLPKSEDSRQPQCPPEKEKAIREAFKYFGMI